MRHLVVLNPEAGRGRNRSLVSRVRAVFRKRDLDFKLVPTTGPGHASQVVLELGPGFDSIVSAGGDGTLYEVIQNLDLNRHRLGIIPLGTGNDFAWLQGWPPDLDRCLDRITAGGDHPVDMGIWHGQDADGKREGRFLNSLGLGFEATVNQESHRITRLKGRAVYILALFRSLRRFRSYTVELTWPEGNFSGDLSLLAMANGRRVGGCFLIAPEAVTDDGKLDLAFAEAMSLPKALLMTPRILSGSYIHRPDVHMVQTASVRMDCQTGIPVYVDGEFLSATMKHMDVEIQPGAIRSF